MLYSISYQKDGIHNTNRAEAANEAAIRVYFRLYMEDAHINGITAAQGEAKPGEPVITVTLPEVAEVLRLHNGYILLMFSNGERCRLCTSERKNIIEVLKAINGGEIAATAEAKKEAWSECNSLEQEERNAKEEDENRQTCKRIAEEVEQVANCEAYKCPHCGSIHSMSEYEDSEHENEDGITCYTCPHCGEEIEENDLEAVSMWDYLDDVLDIDYICNVRGEYTAARFAVALGGPGIYLDTDKQAVCLYWWGNRAQWSLSSEAVNALDEVGEEMFNCL